MLRGFGERENEQRDADEIILWVIFSGEETAAAAIAAIEIEECFEEKQINKTQK